ncbi:epithelial sodium channel subunit gamma-like [Antedon mediterranea]|uniref:epithelial sodium channel subunit gamma-like n=1 Tax=Antedon mediterranea TaxID=105859 RepID=UPI003AF4A4D6
MSEGEQHKEEGDVLPMVNDLLKNSSSHGLPNIYSAQSLVGKFFWAAVFFTGLCLMLWQVYELFVAYFAYEYIVGIEVRFNRSLPFPAVTICNLNPIKQSILERSSEAFRSEFDASYIADKVAWMESNTQQSVPVAKGEQSGPVTVEYYTTNIEDTATESSGSGRKARGANPVPIPPSPPPTSFTTSSNEGINSTFNSTEPPVKSWDELENKEYFEAQSTEYIRMKKLRIALSEIPLEQKIIMGHTLQDILLDCSWKGFQCGPQNFTTFYHYQYGNCYTFNNGVENPVLTTSRPGPNYGLSLELFVDQDEYMEGMTDAAGFRVSVHEPNVMPFPEDDGLSIGPGQRSSLATRVLEMDRLGSPWGDCTDANLYTTKDIFINCYNVKYSKQACERSCYQYAVIEACDCADTHFPFPPEVLTRIRPCDTEANINHRKCIGDMERKYDENDLRCNCNQTCHDTVYMPSVTQSEWPALGYETTLYNRVQERNYAIRSRGTDTLTAAQWIKRNVAKLDVYFMEFNYQYIKQSPATSVMDLLSNIGGQLGLWIGVSVVTLMEMMQLIGAVIGAMIGKSHRPQRTAPSSDREKNIPDAFN